MLARLSTDEAVVEVRREIAPGSRFLGLNVAVHNDAALAAALDAAGAQVGRVDGALVGVRRNPAYLRQLEIDVVGGGPAVVERLASHVRQELRARSLVARAARGSDAEALYLSCGFEAVVVRPAARWSRGAYQDEVLLHRASTVPATSVPASTEEAPC